MDRFQTSCGMARRQWARTAAPAPLAIWPTAPDVPKTRHPPDSPRATSCASSRTSRTTYAIAPIPGKALEHDGDAGKRHVGRRDEGICEVLRVGGLASACEGRRDQARAEDQNSGRTVHPAVE